MFKTFFVSFFAFFCFSPMAKAQEAEWMSEKKVRHLIEEYARNPEFSVQKNDQGDVSIKRRTPLSVSEVADPDEERKDSNWQRMFSLGFEFGTAFVFGKTAEQGRANSGEDFRQYDLTLGVSASVRPTSLAMKRFSFGATTAIRGGQIGPEHRKETVGTDSAGFTPLNYGMQRYTTYFADWDAILIPSNDARYAFTVGFYYGKASDDNDGENDGKKIYSDFGPQFKLRGAMGHGTTPYLVLKFSNRRGHTAAAGINIEFGPRVTAKKKVEK